MNSRVGDQMYLRTNNELYNILSCQFMNYPFFEEMDSEILNQVFAPKEFQDIIGQKHLVGETGILCEVLKQCNIPSMILYGPHGCGKGTIANVVYNECKKLFSNVKFYQWSAETTSINDVKKIINTSTNESQNDTKIIIFLRKIHMFNKLQQDIFLSSLENGVFILIGTTTENPAFTVNPAILSRCRVFTLEKLTITQVSLILNKIINSLNSSDQFQKLYQPDSEKNTNSKASQNIVFENESIMWLARISDGNVKSALNILNIVFKNKFSNGKCVISIKDMEILFIKRNVIPELFDETSQLYNALYHSILNSHENAALYWLVRIMSTKEDPVIIAKFLVKIASSDIDFEDEDALSTSIFTAEACQMIGMPESDVFLTQCVIYLAQAEKCKEVTNLYEAKCNEISQMK